MKQEYCTDKQTMEHIYRIDYDPDGKSFVMYEYTPEFDFVDGMHGIKWTLKYLYEHHKEHPDPLRNYNILTETEAYGYIMLEKL